MRSRRISCELRASCMRSHLPCSWAKHLKFHLVSYVGQLHSNYMGFNMMSEYEARGLTPTHIYSYLTCCGSTHGVRMAYA